MRPPESPLSTPLPWNLVSVGYAAESFDMFAAYAADALSLAQVTASERIVDVAAGPGSLAVQASAVAREVHAVDFAADMLAQLAARIDEEGITNVTARQADGQALPYEDRCFDAAFSMFGLMFFLDRARGFAELFRVLRPGGRAIVASWQPMSRAEVLMALFDALAAELPDLPFTDGKGPLSDPDELRREMGAAGFDVDIVERIHATEAPDIDVFWANARRSFAPLVLLEHRMGADAFAPVADGIGRRLRQRYSAPIRVEMPAWLALGRRP